MTKEKVRKEIRFSPFVAKKIERAAKKTGKTQSELVEKAVKFYDYRGIW